jgi:hypothetical protein
VTPGPRHHLGTSCLTDERDQTLPQSHLLYVFKGGPPGRSRRQCRVVKPRCWRSITSWQFLGYGPALSVAVPAGPAGPVSMWLSGFEGLAGAGEAAVDQVECTFGQLRMRPNANSACWRMIAYMWVQTTLMVEPFRSLG